jgi:hypothetical protein
MKLNTSAALCCYHRSELLIETKAIFTDSENTKKCPNPECYVHYEPVRGYFTTHNGEFGKFLSFRVPTCSSHDKYFRLMFVIENGAFWLACPVAGCRKRVPLSEADLSRISEPTESFDPALSIC